jgi:DNA-binding CsgD family transcriptional regulator
MAAVGGTPDGWWTGPIPPLVTPSRQRLSKPWRVVVTLASAVLFSCLAMSKAAQPVEPAYAATLAAIRHGSHLCAFYETEDDLLDLVVPFCAAGSQRGELCVWVMPDHVDEHTAGSTARKTLTESGTELYAGREFYLKGASFEGGPIVRFWNEKLHQAIATSHSGLCATGDTGWLEQRDWHAFLEYENELNRVIADRRIAVLCTYPFSACKAGDMFDVIRAHQVALAKRQTDWAIIKAPLTDSNADALDVASRVGSLSQREREVLTGVVGGLPGKQIAFNLGISIRTVEAHRTRILRRLGVHTMAEAVRLWTLAQH